jgi:WD40-like Beta Propeller Repeat
MRSLFCAYGISGLLLLGSYASAQNIRLAEGSKNPYFFGGTPSEVRLNTTHQAAFDYLGQPPPGETPQVFARGIVSTDDQQHGSPSFSPDCNEVFWQTNRLDNEKKWHISVMTMLRAGDKWTEPEIAPYSVEPIFSPDGKRLYFESSQPAPAGKGEGPYFAEKQGDRWGERKNLGFVARFPELQFAYNLSITRNSTLYFLGHAAGLGLRNDYGIYRAELINGVYAQPQLLPPSINLPPFMNWTPFIAPDESYLLFSSNRTGSYNEYGDLYVSFRLANGSWTDPINLGKPINSSTQERFPKVSPDGKYLFFTRWTPDHDEDVYWVSAGIIERLKAKANQETLLKADH